MQLKSFFSALVLLLASSSVLASHPMWVRGQARNHLVAQTPVKAANGVVYYGGPVLSNVQVVGVFWGPNVDAQTKAGIGDFYAAITNSTHMDWLNVYDTNRMSVDNRQGTNQHIARGSYFGGIQINPKDQRTTLDKADVQAELEYQVSIGALPKPNASTLYMIHYPAGMVLTTGGEASCSRWCGDHEGFTSKTYGNMYYAMMPDVGGSCSNGCGFAGTTFDSLTMIASHELIEAVTDPYCPDIGKDATYPAAWVSTDQQEVGDLCTSTRGSLQTPKYHYAIQGEWDNSTMSCRTTTDTVGFRR